MAQHTNGDLKAADASESNGTSDLACEKAKITRLGGVGRQKISAGSKDASAKSVASEYVCSIAAATKTMFSNFTGPVGVGSLVVGPMLLLLPLLVSSTQATPNSPPSGATSEILNHTDPNHTDPHLSDPNQANFGAEEIDQGGVIPPEIIRPEAITAGAPIALLIDLQSGQTLYSREPDRRFIPASITKIMTAYVAFQMIDAGELSLDQEFIMSDAVAEQWGRKGSTMFLRAGDGVSLDNLLRGITAVSANDASIILAESAGGSVPGWTAKMNAAARKLGMRNSHFATPNGWPDEGRTFTTARDLAKLSTAMIRQYPQFYSTYFGKSGFAYGGYAQANHDPISGKVEGADGIKTGYTNQAGHGFVGSAMRGDTRLIMVLGAVDTEQRRAQIATDFIKWGFSAFERKTLYQKGDFVGKVRIKGAQDRFMNLLAADTITSIKRARSVQAPTTQAPTAQSSATQDTTAQSSIPRAPTAQSSAPQAQTTQAPTMRLHYDAPENAPIKKGQILAQLHISMDGMSAGRVDLAAAQDAPRAGAFTRFTNMIKDWFD